MICSAPILLKYHFHSCFYYYYFFTFHLTWFLIVPHFSSLACYSIIFLKRLLCGICRRRWRLQGGTPATNPFPLFLYSISCTYLFYIIIHMISGEGEENNTERKARKISYSSRSLKVNAKKWALFFFQHASSQRGKLLVMLLLDILIASVSLGLWTAWKSSLQTTEPHPSTCLSRHWVEWPW